MKHILEAVLIDPSLRDADALEVKAISQTEFLSWT